MKRIIVSILLLGSAASMVLADEAQPPHVTVYGTATTEVSPDQMIWRIRVLNKGPVLDSVASDHSKFVQSALKLLKDVGVEVKTIQTASMEFGQNMEYRNNSQVQEGYFASTFIGFKLKDFGLYNKLWLGLSKISSVSVENVTYDHTKRIQFQNETRQKAVLAAREKADALATALGSTIGEPLLIEEDLPENASYAVNNLRNTSFRLSEGDPEISDGVATGKIPIKTRVRASFRLISKQK